MKSKRRRRRKPRRLPTSLDAEACTRVQWDLVPRPIRISDLPMLAKCPGYYLLSMLEDGRVQRREKEVVQERVSRSMADALRRIGQ